MFYLCKKLKKVRHKAHRVSGSSFSGCTVAMVTFYIIDVTIIGLPMTGHLCDINIVASPYKQYYIIWPMFVATMIGSHALIPKQNVM